MRWPWQSDDADKQAPRQTPDPSTKKPVSWDTSLNATDWKHYAEPRQWVPSLLVTLTVLGSLHFYRSYLRRIPGTDYIKPGYFRSRSLFGRVTSVGDGDNFHLFHTPGGRLAGWDWARRVPSDRKALKGKTIPVRIAGVDAPECSHFGRPAQPYSAEALAWLQEYILNRRVRAYIYRRDQYDRVVATVFIRRGLIPFKRDVGLEMLKRGLATTYEAKSGVEFGGLEEEYKAAEEKAKRWGVGMWAGKTAGESPREYKNRHAEKERAAGKGP